MNNRNTQRIVFVNLHGNEFLVKTLNKIIFKQSVAIKHKYFLDYLLTRNDIEICSYINKRGLSLSYTTKSNFFQSFRFIENYFVLRKNKIERNKITILKKESDLRKDDIVILYRYYLNQLEFETIPEAYYSISMIHFGWKGLEMTKKLSPQSMFNESNLLKHSDIFRHYVPWYNNEFITFPFVFEERFKLFTPFNNRKNKAMSVGTITYMQNITEYYGNSCAQPARKQIRDHADELSQYIDCYNSDYLEDSNETKKITSTDSKISQIYKRLYAKFYTGHQKKYYSFNMVDKFNEYKMCVVGEEIMGIPGIGFVEGMACGCAYIGQNKGYYEDYGMIDGVHYIGYDGTIEDLKAKICYYQKTENQEKLEAIAKNGYDFALKNFSKTVVAEKLLNKLIKSKNRWINSTK